jgi:hypothetical protein
MLGSLERGGLMLAGQLMKLRRGAIIAASKKSKLLKLFGKLELRYTRTHCHARLGNFVTVTHYAVAAKDSSSVAIVNTDPLAGKQISHIHFEEDHYWICFGSGRIREFFKRVE